MAEWAFAARPAVATATAPPSSRRAPWARCPAAPPAPPLACGQTRPAGGALGRPAAPAGFRRHWPAGSARHRHWLERAANRGGARAPPSERVLRGREGAAAAASVAILGVGGSVGSGGQSGRLLGGVQAMWGLAVTLHPAMSSTRTSLAALDKSLARDLFSAGGG